MINRHVVATALFAAAALPLPGAGLTQPAVVSGGASLSQPLFQEAIGGHPASVFKRYAARGSGAGLAAFLRNDAAKLEGSGAVHWIGSEAILSQSQVDEYLTSGLGKLGNPTGHGPLIQVPAAYAPVTISYKGPVQPVTLDRRQICGVFSGAYTKWSQLGVIVAPALDDFTLIFRSDASGTTELLTRHLQAVCGQDSPVLFSGKQVFAETFPNTTLPAHFVAAQGDAGAATAMATHASAITYIGPDPAYTSGLKQAWLVNSYDGVAYLPTPANVMLAVQTGRMPSPPAGSATVRDPTATGWTEADNPGNPVNWIRVSPNPSRGYPIVGSTNLILSQCYSDPVTSRAIKAFLQRHYDDGEDVLRHQLAPLPAAERARLSDAFVTGNDGRGLNIGNAKICADIAGRG